MQYPKIVLPPKYFEDPNLSKFDQIRSKNWFNFVNDRQNIWNAIERVNAMRATSTITVALACKAVGINPDYVYNHNLWVKKEAFAKFYTNYPDYQACLDDAYVNYCENMGNYRFLEFMRKLAPFYKGVRLDPFTRMWEFDATFYPTGYEIRL